MDSTQLIWSGGLLAHLLLLTVLIRQKRMVRFPFFTALIIFYVLRSLALFSLYQHIDRQHYLMLFWSLALGDLLLQIVVLSALLKKAFQRASFSQWKPALGGVVGILFATLLVYFAGPWPSLVTPGTSEVSPLLVLPVLTNKGNLLVAILTLETILALILIAGRSGLGWRSHVQRIAHGLGFYALINMVVQISIQHLSLPSMQTSMEQIRSNMHTIQMLGYLRTASYFVSVVYWIVFLWIDESIDEPEDQSLALSR